MKTLNINNQQFTVDVPDDMPLLWVIRDVIGYTGTKFGCGVGMCGACSVHIDGQVMRSCVMPVNYAEGKNITTIEGLSKEDELHPVQEAWLQADVPQCGYCQSGQIMAAAALLSTNPDPSDDEIKAAMVNLCRCGTYLQIQAAVKQAADIKRGKV
jgi:isoquinoline 1-oxidoreductase alpha subunit